MNIKMSLKDKILHQEYMLDTKKHLYKKCCLPENEYKDVNKERIDFVVDKVLSKQIKMQNRYEVKAVDLLCGKGYCVYHLVPIPIMSSGGKLEHLYIADIVIKNTIIEIDGDSHNTKQKLEYDALRDKQLIELGYIIKRYKLSEIDKLKEETFI